VCGRFTQQRPTAELAELFGAEPPVGDPGARYNVAPTQDALVIVEREGDRRLTPYRWGLVPSWATDPTAGSRMFNARSETAPTSPVFRDALARRRCLVPVDGFYEWRREGGRRQPYLLRRRDGLPLALAGLWATWRDPVTGVATRSFAILTTRPNELVGALHDRMPVVLERSAWDRWLATSAPPSDELLGLLAPCPSEVLEAFAVLPLANDVRRDGPELIEPAVNHAGGDPAEAAPTLGLV
jgi:putative SOS response-associated peptidase YedK